MKINKKKVILVSIIFLIIVVSIILFLYRKGMENRVINEQNEINETGKIDNDLKSKGELKIVEKAMKDYYKDYLEYKEFVNNGRADNLANTLTPDYLNKNKKKLSDIKKEFSKKNDEFNENIDKMIEMLSEKKILSYLDKKKVSNCNYKFYKKIMISSEDKELIKELEEFKEDNKDKYQALIDLIDLLIKKSSIWYVKDDSLYIDNKDTLNKYNELRVRIFNLDRSQEV